MTKRHYFWIAIGLLVSVIVVLLVWFSSLQTGGHVMMAGVSSNGDYAITTDDKDYAILWDLKAHKKHIVSRHADAYSAYWIKQTPYYLWQNYKTKVIHVTNVNTGQDVQTLPLDLMRHVV